MDRESLELLLGQGLSLEQIARRFGKRASTVSYWLEQYGLRAVNREKHAAKGGIEREYLEGLVEAGMREEARKCVLLGANCHAEVENGMTTLPATVRAR